jgi:hypothetical protein
VIGVCNDLKLRSDDAVIHGWRAERTFLGRTIDQARSKRIDSKPPWVDRAITFEIYLDRHPALAAPNLAGYLL